MRGKKSCPGQDSRSCRDWVQMPGCVKQSRFLKHKTTEQKSQVPPQPKHGDFGGFLVRVFDERHGNFILKPVSCPFGFCKGGIL